jgi:hypothetical protein
LFAGADGNLPPVAQFLIGALAGEFDLGAFGK